MPLSMCPVIVSIGDRCIHVSMTVVYRLRESEVVGGVSFCFHAGALFSSASSCLQSISVCIDDIDSGKTNRPGPQRWNDIDSFVTSIY